MSKDTDKTSIWQRWLAVHSNSWPTPFLIIGLTLEFDSRTTNCISQSPVIYPNLSLQFSVPFWWVIKRDIKADDVCLFHGWPIEPFHEVLHALFHIRQEQSWCSGQPWEPCVKDGRSSTSLNLRVTTQKKPSAKVFTYWYCILNKK